MILLARLFRMTGLRNAVPRSRPRCAEAPESGGRGPPLFGVRRNARRSTWPAGRRDELRAMRRTRMSVFVDNRTGEFADMSKNNRLDKGILFLDSELTQKCAEIPYRLLGKPERAAARRSLFRLRSASQIRPDFREIPLPRARHPAMLLRGAIRKSRNEFGICARSSGISEKRQQSRRQRQRASEAVGGRDKRVDSQIEVSPWALSKSRATFSRLLFWWLSNSV